MSSGFNLSTAHEKFQRRARTIFHPLLQRRRELQHPSPSDGDYPMDVWKALVEAGYFECFHAPKGTAAGMGLVGACLLLEELAAADAANLLPVLTAMGLRCLSTAATGELRERILPQLLKGHLPLVFGASERRSGYNILRISTFAARKGNSGYLLNGEKAYVAGADLSPYAVIAARTSEPEPGRRQGLDKTSGLSLFLVRLDSPGLQREPAAMDHVGVLRRYRLGFEDVLVPAAQRIGAEGEGTHILLDACNVERLLNAAIRIGISRFCIDYGRRHGRERSVFGNKPIASYQTLQHPLEEARARLDASRLLLLRAAWGVDNGASPAEIGLYANAIKVLTVEVATTSVDAAMDALGERALDEHTGLVRLRNAVQVGKAVPMSDVLAVAFVSEHALGLPRAY